MAGEPAKVEKPDVPEPVDEKPAASALETPANDSEPPSAPASQPVVEIPPPSQAATETPASPPLFRPRRDLGRDTDRARASQAIPAVIPMVRAPDDPGVDDEETNEAGL